MTTWSGQNLNRREAAGPEGEDRESLINFPKYPEYKEGDSDWVGTVPVSWELSRGKWLFRNRREAPKASDEQLSATQKYGVIPQSYFMESEDQKVTLALSGTSNFRHVDAGDFVISLRSFQGGIEWSRYSGCVSPAYTVMKPSDDVLHTYYRYLLKSDDFISYLKIISDGIRDGKTISYGQFADIVLPVPPKADQRNIAAFLDHETARIDALIDEQKRLIKLLKEKRQAVISHAVTKGFDPNVPMKDSGVEWLGEVPAHWDVKKLSFLFRAEKGSEGAKLTKSFCQDNPGPYPVYSGQTENDGVLGKIDTFEMDLGDEGGILSTTVGAKAMSVSHIRGPISLSQNCMVIRPYSESVVVRFYYYHFQPIFKYERNLIPEHMQASFRMEDLYSFRICQPDIREQQKIVDFLEREIRKIDGLIRKSMEGIDLLSERRSALISAAVTGKIDVRDWQPPASSPQEAGLAESGAPA